MRKWGLLDALQLDEKTDGIYISNVEGSTLSECVDKAESEVSFQDAKELRDYGYSGMILSETLEDAYYLVAVFEGHPECLQHGAGTHNLL